jgi:hypothetical protein
MESDVLFINRCIRTEKINLEIENYNTWTKKQKILFGIYILFFIIISLIFIFAGKPIFGILSAIIAVILIFSLFMLPRSKSKASYHWLCEQQHTETLETKLSFTDETIEYECIPTKGRIQIQYSQIVQNVELTNVILLDITIPKDNTDITLIVLKNGFTQGTLEDFNCFIIKKCPGMKTKLK